MSRVTWKDIDAHQRAMGDTVPPRTFAHVRGLGAAWRLALVGAAILVLAAVLAAWALGGTTPNVFVDAPTVLGAFP